jgi:excisionase family DNA binding protein
MLLAKDHERGAMTTWITLDEAAERLKVSRDTARRMVGRGELPGKRFGKKLIRIDADQLDAAGAALTAKEEAA